MRLWAAAVLFLALLDHSRAQEPTGGQIELLPSGPNYSVKGTINLRRCQNGVLYEGVIDGLSPGFHGFHVHQYGRLGNGCKDAGGHFNPYQTKHGPPTGNVERHVGDLGNIYADANGRAELQLYDEESSLDPTSSAFIGGTSIVIHEGQDDLGRGGVEASLKTGNAGGRVGCGIVVAQSHQVRGQPIALPVCKALTARSVIVGGKNEITGELTLLSRDGGVVIDGYIANLTPGFHGFHIHERGDLGNACSNAGGHFNPFQKTHGHPKDAIRHVGDLGNVEANRLGVAHVHVLDKHVSLDPTSPAYIGGLAFVVHSGADDLGRGGNEGSLKTGNAGGREGCGLIVVPSEGQLVYPGQQNFPGQVPESPPTRDTQTNQNEAAHSYYNPSTEHHNFDPSLNDLNEAKKASVTFENTQNNFVRGSLQITERGFGIFIKGEISGLKPGWHGFHVHQNGATSNNCLDAGGHFNPFNRNHGHPNGFDRHVGDLGNVRADADGVARIAIYDTHASLNSKSEAFIGNRAFVVHENEDDVGRGRNAESLKTGNAGSRLACGVVIMETVPGSSFPDYGQRPISVATVAFPDTAELSALDSIRPMRADVNIVSAGGNSVRGTLAVVESGPGVFIEGSIHGLIPGLHGFHVHEKGQLTNGCVDAGGHFNPLGRNHGHPNSFDRHVGDLGNIEAESDGVARISIYDGHASLDPHSDRFIGGRAFVVHAKQDDLGQGFNAESRKTGNAGSRLACGVIAIKSKSDYEQFIAGLGGSTGFHHFSVGSFFPSHEPVDAISNIRRAKPTGAVEGTLVLRNHYGGVAVTGVINGLTPGLHGFHIHEKGDLGNSCLNAGGHFNPFKQTHGSPKSVTRHIGDLGNILADSSGTAIVHIIDDHISLDPRESTFIGGRAFMVHQGEDDLGQGPNRAESLKTGNAGARVACGTIDVGDHIQQTKELKINFGS